MLSVELENLTDPIYYEGMTIYHEDVFNYKY